MEGTTSKTSIPINRIAIAAVFSCVLAYALASPHSPLAPVAVAIGFAAGDLS